jgi:nucleolar protein 14
VLKLLLHLASDESPPFNVIAALIVHLHKLATQFPAALTPEIFSAIESGRKRMTQSLSTGKTFPAAKDLVLFYAVGQIYPTSDLSHIIVNPTTLFIGQILGQMKVKTGQDLGRGLFMCSMFLDVCLFGFGLIVVSKNGEADLS